MVKYLSSEITSACGFCFGSYDRALVAHSLIAVGVQCGNSPLTHTHTHTHTFTRSNESPCRLTYANFASLVHIPGMMVHLVAQTRRHELR